MLLLTMILLCLVGDAKAGVAQRLARKFSNAENKHFIPQ